MSIWGASDLSTSHEDAKHPRASGQIGYTPNRHDINGLYPQLYGHFDDFQPLKNIQKSLAPFNCFKNAVSVADEEKYEMGAYRLLYTSV